MTFFLCLLRPVCHYSSLKLLLCGVSEWENYYCFCGASAVADVDISYSLSLFVFFFYCCSDSYGCCCTVRGRNGFRQVSALSKIVHFFLLAASLMLLTVSFSSCILVVCLCCLTMPLLLDALFPACYLLQKKN